MKLAPATADDALPSFSPVTCKPVHISDNRFIITNHAGAPRWLYESVD